MATHFNTHRIHLSRDLLLSDNTHICQNYKEMILCVALWNASAEGTCYVMKITKTLKTGPSQFIYF